MGLNDAGVPGRNLPAGEDWLVRKVKDLERAYLELVAATGLRAGAPIVGASISTAVTGARWELTGDAYSEYIKGFSGIPEETFPGTIQVNGSAGPLTMSMGSPQIAGMLQPASVAIQTWPDTKTEVHLKADRIVAEGLRVYATNAAAITGGLTVGSLYRNGADPDHVCIVH